MKRKKTLSNVFEEIIANGIGWIAGLLSIDILKVFFIEKKWINAWGIFSKKTAVSGTTFSFLEWTLTAIIGFAVMLIVNKFVRKKFFNKLPIKKKTNNESVKLIEAPEIENPTSELNKEQNVTDDKSDPVE